MVNKELVVVFRRIFCENLGKSDISGKFGLFGEGFMIKRVVVKRFYKRAHLIELPNLVLEGNSVDKIGETNIV
jgi:hypothetical protein